MIFKNQEQAGNLLAERLSPFREKHDALILCLSEEGVPVAVPVASKLRIPLDMFLIQKVCAPGQDDLAIGAVTSHDLLFLNKTIIKMLDIEYNEVKEHVQLEYDELLRKETAIKGFRSLPMIKNKHVILIDESIVSGVTMKTGIQSMRNLGAKTIHVAVPVGNSQAVHKIEQDADEFVCLQVPDRFRNTGHWFENYVHMEESELREKVLNLKLEIVPE